MEEIWKTIEEAPHCQVSNRGRVKVEERTIIASNGSVRIYPEKMIIPSLKKNGYLEVALPVEKGKRIYRTVHRLVMVTFQPIPNMEKLEVNHIDENKQNNNIENLEWLTSKENCNYGTRNLRLSQNSSNKKKVRCIETQKIYESARAASKETGACYSSISDCCNSKANVAKGLHWEFVKE